MAQGVESITMHSLLLIFVDSIFMVMKRMSDLCLPRLSKISSENLDKLDKLKKKHWKIICEIFGLLRERI